MNLREQETGIIHNFLSQLKIRLQERNQTMSLTLILFLGERCLRKVGETI